VGWVHLVQDGVHWRAFVNTVMNLEFLDQLSEYQFLKKVSAPRSYCMM